MIYIHIHADGRCRPSGRRSAPPPLAPRRPRPGAGYNCGEMEGEVMVFIYWCIYIYIHRQTYAYITAPPVAPGKQQAITVVERRPDYDFSLSLSIFEYIYIHRHT